MKDRKFKRVVVAFDSGGSCCRIDHPHDLVDKGNGDDAGYDIEIQASGRQPLARDSNSGIRVWR